MEKQSVAATVETHALTGIQTTMAQADFKPGHKRSGSDVTGKQSENILVPASRTRTKSESLRVEDEHKSRRRKNSDVVDSIGDRLYDHHDVEKTATEVEGAVGGGQRPTNLDMKPTVDAEQNQKQEAWKSTNRCSKEETDATPCTPPEITYDINSDPR
jgi:hypothetical protein